MRSGSVRPEGEPARVQDPLFESTDPAILAVIPDPDGNPLKCTASAVGPTGSAELKFTGDADLGAGVRPIISSESFVVNAGEATVIAMKFGEPTEQ